MSSAAESVFDAYFWENRIESHCENIWVCLILSIKNYWSHNEPEWILLVPLLHKVMLYMMHLCMRNQQPTCVINCCYVISSSGSALCFGLIRFCACLTFSLAHRHTRWCLTVSHRTYCMCNPRGKEKQKELQQAKVHLTIHLNGELLIINLNN